MSQRFDLIIDQGSDFAIDIDLFDDNGDPDQTEYTAQAMMRKNYTSSNAYSFVCTVADSVLTLSLAASVSSNIVAGRYFYDVELTDVVSNTVHRIMEGQITLTPQVTRG
jgi:hypothetical protein